MNLKTIKLDRVQLKELGPNLWQLRWRDPASKRDIRQRINCTEKEAGKKAAYRESELRQARGLDDGPQTFTPTLREGITESLRLSSVIDQTKKDRMLLANLWLEWMEARYPAAERWSDVKPSMMLQYVKELEDGKLARPQKQPIRPLKRQSISLRIDPIRLAWKLMQRDYPDLVLGWPEPRLKADAEGHKIVNLPPAQLPLFLEWLQRNDPYMLPIAALQSLAGLRVLEALYLRREDVDLQNGTITITKTELHAPKNRYSYRTIPICGAVIEALAPVVDAFEARKGPYKELFITMKFGAPWKRYGISSRYGDTIAKARAELKIEIAPAKKLRSTFATLVDEAGFAEGDALVIRYMGQDPQTVHGRAYRAISDERLLEVCRTLNNWAGKNLAKIFCTKRATSIKRAA